MGTADTRRPASRVVTSYGTCYRLSVCSIARLHGSGDHLGRWIVARLAKLDRVGGARGAGTEYAAELDYTVSSREAVVGTGD
jgi:hypothetical protein